MNKYVPAQHNLYTFVTLLSQPTVVANDGLILPKAPSSYQLAVVEIPRKGSSLVEGDIVVYHKSFAGAVELEHDDLDKKYVYLHDDNMIKCVL